MCVGTIALELKELDLDIQFILTLFALCFKNGSPLTCYEFDSNQFLKIVYSRHVAKYVSNQTMLCFSTSPNYCRW